MEQKNESKDFKEKAKDILNDVKDESKSFSKKDVESGKLMAILAYIIAPIPYFAEKNNKYVRYHATQGMNLFLIIVAYGILNRVLTSVIKVNSNCGPGYWGELVTKLGQHCEVTPWWVIWPLCIVGLCISIIGLIGIINVCNGKAKELPVVNKLKVFKMQKGE